MSLVLSWRRSALLLVSLTRHIDTLTYSLSGVSHSICFSFVWNLFMEVLIKLRSPHTLKWSRADQWTLGGDLFQKDEITTVVMGTMQLQMSVKMFFNLDWWNLSLPQFNHIRHVSRDNEHTVLWWMCFSDSLLTHFCSEMSEHHLEFRS